jgi:hypothetical protein
MHHLKDIEFSDWTDKHYNGKAVKMGAGVQGFEVSKAAFDQGLQVVTGSCPTVGVAGGYSQGGGHSALTSLHGMAADQVLEWEVITAGGEHVFATRDQNTDLYWALSGGGGGTYGIVLSMTSKAHQDTSTAGANLTFASTGLSQDEYYSLIDEFQRTVLPASTKAGVTTTFYVTNQTFAMRPMTGPGLNSTQLRSFVDPFMKKLDAKGVRYASFFGDFDSYTEFYAAMYQALAVNAYVYTGRLLPRDVVMNNGQGVVDTFRFLNQHGAIVVGIGLNASSAANDTPDNSVNPGWRDTMVSLLIVTPWSYKVPLDAMQDTLETITDELTPRLTALTPGGTTYLSEGDYRDPDWKEHFYGANYDKLAAIKDKYDPEHMFYAPTVGLHHTSAASHLHLTLTFSCRLLELTTGNLNWMVVFARRDRRLDKIALCNIPDPSETVSHLIKGPVEQSVTLSHVPPAQISRRIKGVFLPKALQPRHTPRLSSM